MSLTSAFVVWLTGRPGSGKTTIANALAAELRRRGADRVELLDGDELRATALSRGLGFSREDRDENVRRVGFVAGLLARNGVVAIVSLVSPYEGAREEVRAGIDRFVLVHADCAPEELARRDPKGHYAKARRGEMASFTGVSDPYEPPMRPDLRIRTDEMSVAHAVARIVEHLERAGYLAAAPVPSGRSPVA